MSHHYYSYDWKIYELIPDYSNIIDIGFGYGAWGYQLKVRRKAKNIIGIEPYLPYCNNMNKLNIYDEIMNKNIFEVPKYSLYKSKNIVLCCDVIEHINRYEADSFIELLESWGDTVIITTPNGNMKNEQSTDGNELNKHRSYYDRKFFSDRGYTTESVRYYPAPPKIFRWMIDLYWLIKVGNIVDSQIVAFKKCR